MQWGLLLKKALGQMLMPLSIVLSLLAIGIILLWLRRFSSLGKYFASIAFILLLLFSSPWFANKLLNDVELMHVSYNYSDKNIDYIVVLGHTSKANAQLKSTSQLSQTSINRLVEGLRIYRLHPNSRIIFSGWKSQAKGSHPERMRNLAVALGIPGEQIVLLNGPLDTYEEALGIKPLVADKAFVLVTSASHMKRAMAIFKKQHMNPIAAPTGHLVKTPQVWSFVPSLQALAKTQTAFYEYLAYGWAWLRGRVD